jgi:hypothetical protein
MYFRTAAVSAAGVLAVLPAVLPATAPAAVVPPVV